MKSAFSQGAWPQATDYADLIDSFALVSEIPSGQGGGDSRQQVVDVPAGAPGLGNGVRYPIKHQQGKFPCVNVYVKDDQGLRKLFDAELIIELGGTTQVFVTVKSQTVDVARTGMIVVLS